MSYRRNGLPSTRVEAGHQNEVLREAREFRAASPDERSISRYFWSDIADARRLSGEDVARAADIARIAELLLKALRKPEHVIAVAQTQLPSHGDQRMVDLILAGRERDVLEDLASGAIEPRALLDDGFVDFSGW